MESLHLPLAAETLFRLRGWPVTNTLVNAFLMTGVSLLMAAAVRVSVSARRPGRFQLFAEMVLVRLMDFFDQVTHDRKKTRAFLPLVGTLFFFILFSNWIGTLPGMGSIGLWQQTEHGRELVPLLRSANSDLNLTLAMALVSVAGSHIIGIAALGWWEYLNKFFQVRTLYRALRSKKPVRILTALVECVVGIIEAFGELAKVASLSLRLFGNIFAGEVLLAIIYLLAGYVLPLPFVGLEIIVGFVQATVFSALTLVYVSLMTAPAHGDDDHGGEAKPGGHVSPPVPAAS